MKPKDIKDILIALNSTTGSMREKYPFGNKELTEKVKTLETQGLIAYNVFEGFWYKTKQRKVA